MPAGASQYVIQGGPSGTSNATAPCEKIGGAGYKPVMVQAYVIDPASQPYIDGITEPFDYVAAGVIWTFFFSFVVSLWVVAKNAGVVINAVRKF